jgi:hypothetical protein
MRRRLVVLAGVVALGLGGYLVAGGAARLSPAPAPNPDPVLDCPEVVDVGEHEIHSLAVGRFTVTNRGGAELVLDNVRTSCACSGLEQERGDRFVRVTELRVPPGESVGLVIRRAVGGAVGVSLDSPVYFRTNDPAAPERALRLVVSRVKGGVEATPRSVAFGSVPVGKVVREVVDVTDEWPDARALDRVVSSAPGRVRVRQLPPEPSPDGTGRGRPLARLEITVDTRSPAAVDDRVEVYVAGRSFPTVVPVSGKVTAAVEVSPATVLLPRKSDSGPLYEATCLCRSTEGKPLTLRVESAPPDVRVETPEPDGSPPVRSVVVRWDPSHPAGGAAGRRVVRLVAGAAGAEVPVEITILCEPTGAP